MPDRSLYTQTLTSGLALFRIGIKEKFQEFRTTTELWRATAAH
jgi:hypothetical protein